jgi:dienelactone hydrolase
MFWKTAAGALGVGLLCAGPALALDETVSIASRAISDEAFLRGDDSAAAAITITGRLSGPDSDKPVPVVILLHGTDGPRSGAAGAWRAFLNSKGITTLRLDSYTGRGLEQASSNQASFGQFAQIYDAFRAADTLAADTRIDASHIVIMGFSRGGTAALYSAMSRFQEAFGPRRAKIAAHIPFYPACNFELKDELRITSAPIRLFHGSADDWAPPERCRTYIQRLKDASGDAEMTEYGGALHAFDNASNPALYKDSDNQT